MRAILHLRRSNLSWGTLSTHFNPKVTYGAPAIQDMVESHKESSDQSNNILQLSGMNISSYKDFPSSEFNKKSEDSEIFYDRFAHQLSVIQQIPKSYLNDNVAMTTSNLEGTVHSCMAPLRRELKDLFPGRNITSADSVLSVICLNHRTEASMSAWDASVAREREALAHSFVKTAKEICNSLSQCGFWADFIDPYSGTPWMGEHTNETLFETDPRMRNFGLQVQDLGCCKVLSHPVWRENVFTGVIFTDAPPDHSLLSSLGYD